MNSGKLKTLSLFSGIGGIDKGLEESGFFETVAFCEIDKDCHKILNKHWPEVPIYEDVKNLDLVSLQHIGIEKIDAIVGGFPCQDVSVAGKQKGLIDGKGNTTRSGLWFEYKRLIKEIRPRYVIIENVRNLLSNGFATVLKDLYEIGYDAEWHVISARDVGAPHLRERLWIIAYPNCEFLREQSRGSGGKDRKNSGIVGNYGEERNTPTPDPYNFRLWRPFTSKEEKSEWWAERTLGLRDRWETESSICRVANGLPSGLHTPERVRKQRIRQLGNAVVPQILTIIGKAIEDYEARKCL